MVGEGGGDSVCVEKKADDIIFGEGFCSSIGNFLDSFRVPCGS